MKAVIQRVNSASVSVESQTVGRIDQGILAYIGLGHEDTTQQAERMIDKILTYRIFANERDKLDYNLMQVQGGLLLVSQFTLMANTHKGRRPDFGGAMAPDQAERLFAEMVHYAALQYDKVAAGRFGANMQVTSINDGPLTFILDI